MELRVRWPSEWAVREVRAIAPGLDEVVVRDDLAIRVRCALPLPAGIESWIESAMTGDPPPGTTPRRIASERSQSRAGWPVSIVRHDFVDGAGRIVERRLGVMFRLLYNGAEVIVHARDPDRFADADRLLPIILDASVAWPAHDHHTLHGLLGVNRRTDP